MGLCSKPVKGVIYTFASRCSNSRLAVYSPPIIWTNYLSAYCPLWLMTFAIVVGDTLKILPSCWVRCSDVCRRRILCTSLSDRRG